MADKSLDWYLIMADKAFVRHYIVKYPISLTGTFSFHALCKLAYSLPQEGGPSLEGPYGFYKASTKPKSAYLVNITVSYRLDCKPNDLPWKPPAPNGDRE